MKKYLSHYTAAYHWDIPCLNDVLGSRIIKKYKPNQILDITMVNRNMRNQKHNCRIHASKFSIPRGAVIKCGENYISSPELTFLQLAGELDIHRLILLGLQMCSHPAGKEAEAITTKRKLANLLAKMRGYLGHPKAVRALQYIENESASIMESFTFMILTLPHAYGGFGLKGAVFNHEIRLDSAARQYLGQNRCYADLFYQNAKLAVEYDSRTYHNESTAQDEDLLRVTALEHQGLDVIRINASQLKNKKACRDFAENVATRLGKRIRIRAQEFHREHNKLRRMIPSNSPQ